MVQWCGCVVGGGAVPLCEVREVREGMSGVIGSVVLGGFLGVNGPAVWRFGGLAVARHVIRQGGINRVGIE